MEHDTELEAEDFDLAATRPPLTFGLPHTLSTSLIFGGAVFLLVYRSGGPIATLVGDVIGLAGLGMVWTAVRLLLRQDYHGWGNFLAWVSLDARCLDSRDCGGTRLSSFPLRSIYRCGAHDGD